MNDNLQSLHGTANNALVRLLFQRVCELRSGSSDNSEAVKALARWASLSTDEAWKADTGIDIGGSESGGVEA